MRKILTLAAILLLVAVSALAEVPKVINYQAKLTDADGVALNGDYDITFSIWDAATGGACVWGPETHSSVTVTNGLFDVQLGTITTLDIDFSDSLWIEVEVEGVTLGPREKLGTVPYAFRAIYADTAETGGANTLDEAYDGPSGSGSGRIITADALAVRIEGATDNSALELDGTFNTGSILNVVQHGTNRGATIVNTDNGEPTLYLQNSGNSNALYATSAGSNAIWSDKGITIAGGNAFRMRDSDATNYISFHPPDLTNDNTYTLPNAYPGDDDDILVSSTGGVMEWKSLAELGGTCQWTYDTDHIYPNHNTDIHIDDASGTYGFYVPASAGMNIGGEFEGGTNGLVGIATGNAGVVGQGPVGVVGENAADNSILGRLGTASYGVYGAQGTGGTYAGYFDGNGYFSGNVGIGTSPSYKLEVAGDAGFDAHLYHNDDDNTYIYFTPDRIQFYTGGRSMIDVQYSDNEVAINEGSTQTDFRVEGGTDTHLLFTDGSTDRVGIGTASPSSKLDVNGDLRVDSPTFPGRDYRISCGGRQEIYTNNDLVEHVSGNKAVIVGTSLGANRDFYICGETEATKIFTVEGDDQQVGIGTTSPTTQLHTTGGVRFQGVGSTSSNTQILTMDSNGNLAYRNAGSWAGGTDNVTGTGINNRVAYWTGGHTLSYDNLYWDSLNDRLGIGISPSWKLHVNGTGYFNDGVTINAPLSGTTTALDALSTNTAWAVRAWDQSSGRAIMALANTSSFATVEAKNQHSNGTGICGLGNNLSASLPSAGAGVYGRGSTYGGYFDGGDGTGVYGTASGTGNPGGYFVNTGDYHSLVGSNDNLTYCATMGYNASGDGVLGIGSGAGTYLHSGSGDGVIGVSDAGSGVIGSHYNGSNNNRWGALGTSTNGVYGTTDNSSGAGVFGSGGSVTTGVYGTTSASDGYGVWGIGTASDGNGVLGTGSNCTHILYSGNGDGLIGVSDAGYGVIGSYYDGSDNNRYGYLGGSSYGVYGHNDAGDAIRGQATRTSTDDYGVWGTCNVTEYYGYGGYFEGGYKGLSARVSPTPTGSNTYYGLSAYSSSGTGGTGTNIAVYGYASGGAICRGGRFRGSGAFAYIAYQESSGDTTGGYFDGGTSYAYVASDEGTDDTYGGYFDGNTGTNDYCYVGLRYSGIDYSTNGAGPKSTMMDTRAGRRNLFCPESPEVWFEDLGSAKLVNGHCHIELDPLFFDCVKIDQDHPMKVFIQLNDDCNGVYVKKGTTGFDVYKLNGGTSDAAFDYRIMAKRRGEGYEDVRFPPAPPRQKKKIDYLDLTKDIWEIPQEYRLEWVKQVPPTERDPEWLKALTPEQIQMLGKPHNIPSKQETKSVKATQKNETIQPSSKEESSVDDNKSPQE